MLDRMEISKRFFLCYPGKSKRALGKIFDVGQPAVSGWEKKGIVPWNKLKYLSDSQAISWDWLFLGIEPKESAKEARIAKSTKPSFPVTRINRRFLSLFEEMSQTRLAALLDVTTSTVNDWKRGKRRVAWERLDDAVETHCVRWDWLLDGLEPKYRE